MAVNPVARILDAAGLGLKEFTQESGVAQTTVQELIWGLFPDVPPRLSAALAKVTQEHGLDYEMIFSPEKSLNAAYHRWQKIERQQLIGEITVLPVPTVNGPTSPFAGFVQDVAPTGLRTFCNRLKLPRATTQRYASGATVSMPTTIAAALEQIEYPHIQELKRYQDAWLRVHG